MSADDIPRSDANLRAPGGTKKPLAHKQVPGQRSVRQRTRLNELLLQVSRRMAAYDTLDEVLHALVDMTTAQLDAERGTLFLNDPATNELYSRVAQGNIKREIRLLNTTGIAGHVYTSGEPLIAAPGTRKVVGSFFSHAREAHGIWTNPENTLLYIAHEQDELPGTPNAGQTCCTAFDVSDPLRPRFIAQIPLGALKLPSGELRNKKSINLVYVRPGARGQTG